MFSGDNNSVGQDLTGELTRVRSALAAQTRLLTAVAEVSSLLARSENFAEAVGEGLRLVCQATGLSRASLWEERRQPTSGEPEHALINAWSEAAVPGYEAQDTVSIASSDLMQFLPALKNGRSLWCERESIQPPLNDLFDRLKIQTTGWAPIFMDGTYAGAVSFDQCHRSKSWDEDKMDALTAAANIIAAAMQSKRDANRLAEEQASNLADANDALRTAADSLVEATTLEDMLAVFLQQAVRVAGASTGHILSRRAGTHFELVSILDFGTVVTGETLRQLPIAKRVSALSKSDETGYFTKKTTGQATLWKIEQLGTWFPEAADWHRERGNRTSWSIPFFIRNSVAGYLTLGFQQEHEPDTVVQETISTLSNQMAIALEMARLASEAREAAVTREREQYERDLAEERSRIAREMHDTLLQGFMGVTMQLRAISKTLMAAEHSSAGELASICEESTTAIREARKAVGDMRASAGEAISLIGSVERMIEYERARNANLQITYQCEGVQPMLSDAKKEGLFRVTREALRNAIQHAQATHIHVDLRFDETLITVIVVDDGTGFEAVEQEKKPGHWGLTGIRERAHTLGGKSLIESSLGEGSRIIVEVPQ